MYAILGVKRAYELYKLMLGNQSIQQKKPEPLVEPQVQNFRQDSERFALSKPWANQTIKMAMAKAKVKVPLTDKVLARYSAATE